MKRLCFVVHRYAPYPGGSENYVRDMAEEAVSRGHDVWVLSGEHKGDLNGVKVTSDANILTTDFDLIIVHGGDVSVQDFVLLNADKIKSKMLFMLILPSESQTYKTAMRNVRFIGCSTPKDWRFAEQSGFRNKSVRVIHGIDEKKSIGMCGFKSKYNITTKYMFLSSGGYWPNKAFDELVNTFNKIERDDITLVLTGYDNRHNLMPKSESNVKSFILDNRYDVLSAIKEADLYIMNSYVEGFGLVLLESMLNKTPWAARLDAGSDLMQNYGFTYTDQNQLLDYMKNFQGVDSDVIENSYEYMIHNHLIRHTVDDIEKLLKTQ